jgi:hypothetical protein
MSNVLRIQWTILPRIAPQPWLNCNRCGEPTRFESSDKVRVNAQGKRLDAWLVYNCTTCKNSWNRPLFERRNIRDIDPSLLDALLTNGLDYVRRVAFDLEDLRRKSERIEEFPDVDIRKETFEASGQRPHTLELWLVAPLRVSCRLDRLLATQLGLSRSRVEELATSGIVQIPIGGIRMLRRPVRDQTTVRIRICDLVDEFDIEAAAGRVDRTP